MTGVWRPRRLVGVSLNAAVDKIVEVEQLVVGRIHRPVVRSVVAGGKAINVARAATTLGLPSTVVALVAGTSGDWIESRLRADRLRGTFVRVDGESRTCLSILDGTTGQLTELYEAGMRLTPDRWPDVGDALRTALVDDPTGALVVLAGSLPPGSPVDAYAQLGQVARAAGAKVVVDIAGPSLAAALVANPWLVKVNAAEAAEVTGLPVTNTAGALAAAHGIRASGAHMAIVTLGIQGAVLASAGTDLIAGPAPQRGPFSVGSGDAMLAGFAVALSRGMELPDALRLGVAAGAANALMPGQGNLDAAVVGRLFERSSVA